MAWQHISPAATVKGFGKCCISSEVDGTDDGMLRNGSEADGMFGVSVGKTKGLTFKMEMVTVTGEGR
jgi:hypothetical protein